MDSGAIELESAAKLNLRLNVVGRRADGYHLLDGEVVRIGWCDRVVLTPRRDGRIVREWRHSAVAAEDDITVRAAKKMRQVAADAALSPAVQGDGQGQSFVAASTPSVAADYGVGVEVEKSVPVGAGLGGASANAAAVLLGLNRMWGMGLSVGRLMALGLELGADVPFFVSGVAAARVGGVGERLRAVAAPAGWYVVVVPSARAETAAVYGRYRAAGREETPLPFVRGQNDLAAAAVYLYPQILAAAEVVAEVCGEARLSGSGSAIFATFGGRELAEKCQQTLAHRNIGTAKIFQAG